MESNKFNKYKVVADVIEKALNTLEKLCIPDTKINELSKFTDEYILAELNKTYKNLKKGLAMPTCISVNNIICHYVPTNDDEYKLKSGDIIRIEATGFIDDCCVTLGNTIEVETYKLEDLKVAQIALSTGIKLIEPFMEIKEFDKLIKKIIEPYGLYLLERPYVFNEEQVSLEYDWARREEGKFLEQSWIVKCDEEIDLEDLNVLSDEKLDKDTHFNTGDVYHLEIALSKNKNACSVSDRPGSLYQRTYKKYPLKSKYAREMLTEVNKKIGNYFFRLSDLELSESKAKLGMRECLNHNIFRNLGLIERREYKVAPVVRLKCSVIVQKNSVYILTGKSNILDKIDDKEKNKEILNIFNKNSKFSKRYQEESQSI